ncbi:MAG: elongation factor P [Armatimonadota bacterium]|nr:elongation factor P [Armatimonadota bacterium]MDR7450387.1 elongation factor P [Armatimonadota bacterium]MDR7467030.1 elongation factor P [Armatimonadota bacterium]MDR7493428.1 elongation factor P [Armatimonadota bacterium]MDR7498693.1 elongation factor P [Armatimonadota bacterium]
MIASGEFRPGVVVELDGELFAVVQTHHHKRAQRQAFVRAKLRNVRTGAVLERNFTSDERVRQVYLDRKPMQFLYVQGDEYVMMDHETFEQLPLHRDLLGDAVHFLKENTDVTVVFYEGRPIGVELPNTVELQVVETSPGFRGDTAAGSSKPARLETGVTVQVPFFVNVGDRVRVDTRTGQYLERVK